MKFNVRNHFVEQVGCTENDEKEPDMFLSLSIYFIQQDEIFFIILEEN